MIDIFHIDCPSPPKAASYAAPSYKYRCSRPCFQTNTPSLPELLPSSAPAGCPPTHNSNDCSGSLYLSGLSWPSSPSIYQKSLVSAMWIFRTVDGIARNCPSSPVLKIILAAYTAIGGLQRMRLMSMHGALPAPIRCRSSAQFQHSSKMCCTVCGPWPH